MMHSPGPGLGPQVYAGVWRGSHRHSDGAPVARQSLKRCCNRKPSHGTHTTMNQAITTVLAHGDYADVGRDCAREVAEADAPQMCFRPVRREVDRR